MTGKKNIAILGATSHIAKGLIFRFLNDEKVALHLYARSAGKIMAFMDSIGQSLSRDRIIYEGYDNLYARHYDVLINCVGVGTLNKMQADYTRYFTVTEEYDNLSLDYLRKHQETLYISFSSGAVYGRDLSGPASENTTNAIKVNYVVPQDYYAIARLYAEAKHRAFSDLRIVDLRVFSYFSRFIDLTDNYFITDIMDCILNKRTFVTDDFDIVRDFVHPQDLFAFVNRCIMVGKINASFDVISSKPVNKWEIINYFSSQYGLQYEKNSDYAYIGGTGTKNIYCSQYNNGTRIGYTPKFSAMDAIAHESKYILKRK